MDRVINRVIPNFVALCNKLVFRPIFTRVGLKKQVGEGGFTWVGLFVSPGTGSTPKQVLQRRPTSSPCKVAGNR